MKKQIMLIAALALATAAGATNTSAPSNISANPTVRARANSYDGNGQVMSPGVIGYKVFEDSGSSAAWIVVDETSSTPKAGLVHQVCISSGTGAWVLALDSASASGVTDLSAGALFPPWMANATLATCTPVLDVEFHNGVVIVNSNAAVSSYLYWRPIGGKN